MQASSFNRRLLTMSRKVAIIAGRFLLVSSEVSTSIPNEIALSGAAIPVGPAGGRAGSAILGGSRRVSSKPNSGFFLSRLLLGAEAEAVTESVFALFTGALFTGLAAGGAPEEGLVLLATTAAGCATRGAGLPITGGASRAAALARYWPHPASLPPSFRYLVRAYSDICWPAGVLPERFAARARYQ